MWSTGATERATVATMTGCECPRTALIWPDVKSRIALPSVSYTYEPAARSMTREWKRPAYRIRCLSAACQVCASLMAMTLSSARNAPDSAVRGGFPGGSPYRWVAARSGRQQCRREAVGQPSVEGGGAPAALSDQQPVEVSVCERPAEFRGTLLGYADGQSVQGREIPDEHGSAQHPVAARLGEQLCGRRIDIGCGDENFAERRGAGGDVGHGLHPEHECLPRVGLGQDRLDRRAVGQGYRLVVADDGPIQGQLEQGHLAAHRVEHGTPAHLRGLRDPVDRRGRITLGQEQVVSRGDDRPPGTAGLLVAHPRRVPLRRLARWVRRPGRRIGRARCVGWGAHRDPPGALTFPQIRCTISTVITP